MEITVSKVARGVKALLVLLAMGMLCWIFSVVTGSTDPAEWISARVAPASSVHRVAGEIASGGYDRALMWGSFVLFLLMVFAWLVPPIIQAIRRIRAPFGPYWSDKRLKEILTALASDLSVFLHERNTGRPHPNGFQFAGPNDAAVQLAMAHQQTLSAYDAHTLNEFERRFFGKVLAAISEMKARGFVGSAEEMAIVNQYLTFQTPLQIPWVNQQPLNLLRTMIERL